MFSRRIAVGFTIASAALVMVYFVSVNLLDRLRDNVPIVFYGQLLDQDGNPVSGATINGYVQAEKRLSIPVMGADNSIKWDVSARTDANGKFEILGGHGQSLYLKSISGIECTDFRSKEYDYGTAGMPVIPYHSDPFSPEVFHIWKRRGGEHRAEKHIEFALKTDGTQNVVDLVRGGQNDGANGVGDLRLSAINQMPTDRSQPKELIFKMEANDGGLVRCEGDFPYEAPAEGYVPSLTFKLHPGNDNSGDPSGYFYLKSRHGQVYAVFMISVACTNYPHGSISYRVNETGSRVLEP